MEVARILFWLAMCVICLAVSPGWAADPRLDPRLAPQTLVPLPLRISSVTLNPSTVTGGTTQVLGTVTLSQPAFSSGVMVTLQSSNPTVAPVPASVPIQPGATAATFVITTQPVAGNPNVVNPNPPSVQISAHIGTSTPMIAQLTVLPPMLTALTLNPANVPGGTASTGTVAISGPAPPGGVLVTLSGPPSRGGPITKNLQNPVSMPPQIMIPAGATSASFSVQTRPVVQSTPVQITATWSVFVTKTATLTMLPAEIGSFSADPWAQLGGAPATGTITLTAPAPPEGMTLYFSQFGSVGVGESGGYPQCGQIPTMPSTVTVAGGSMSVPVPITTYPGYGTYMAYACRLPLGTCQGGGVQLTYNVNVYGFKVMPPFLTSTSLVVPSSVKGGTPIQGTLHLLGKAVPANCGNSYPLTSSNPLLAQVPPYVTVAPGSSQATFTITTSATTTAQPVTISVAQAVPYSDFQNGIYNYSVTLMTVSAPLTITP
jgi:hypothetical protein